jgi:hypothetical protein
MVPMLPAELAACRRLSIATIQRSLKLSLAAASRSAIDSYAAGDGFCHAHQREFASRYTRKAQLQTFGWHLVRRRSGSDDFPDCPDRSDRARCQPSNRKHLVGIRDTWRSHSGRTGFRGLRMVHRQSFHFTQRRRRIPNLAISRGRHFAAVVALRLRCLVTSAYRRFLQFRIWSPFPAHNTVLKTQTKRVLP